MITGAPVHAAAATHEAARLRRQRGGLVLEPQRFSSPMSVRRSRKTPVTDPYDASAFRQVPVVLLDIHGLIHPKRGHTIVQAPPMSTLATACQRNGHPCPISSGVEPDSAASTFMGALETDRGSYKSPDEATLDITAAWHFSGYCSLTSDASVQGRRGGMLLYSADNLARLNGWDHSAIPRHDLVAPPRGS
ncbi:hypothetical protein PG999_007493 [Apiospora kogelbergensis]|uniref:Uncharacterized protein n=1 Tax=Apiospora kogelbergensis TaxID=1337665 RepID=A0AAW0QYF3_9PEZI